MNNKKILFSILSASILLLPLAILAQQPGPVDPANVIEKIKTAFITIGSYIVVIGWIVTGILYLTAAGGERVAVAKKSLIACVIGTVVIILAVVAEAAIKKLILGP